MNRPGEKLRPAEKCHVCGSERAPFDGGSSRLPSTEKCSQCGALLLGSTIPNEVIPHPPIEETEFVFDTDSVATTHFIPGTLLLDRYRIDGLIGVGGMGAVYRAEDLQLQQTVALKFLDANLQNDPTYIELLRNEVRLAREVSHPNICRVHDLGEIQGRPFLSMNYIDGEDLRSLLRRAGRISGERANQIARQLCAGLFAAHQRGVAHRDLKPANVMIDDDGQVQITDFGIASRVGAESETTAGTPAYMAPELLEGESATPRSDIYSLGLVLYELFTGSPPHSAASLTELIALRRKPPSTPALATANLDPSVEQLILSCLHPRPAGRPQSAMAVLAALPGGDPLAESLRSGATPTPEMIAAVGEVCRTAPTAVWGFVLVITVTLVALMTLDPMVKELQPSDLPFAASVLEDRARAHLSRFRIPTADRSHASGFEFEGSDTRHPTFYYRQVPQPTRLMSTDLRGRVTFQDPPALEPASVRVRTTPTGALLDLFVVPSLDATREPSDSDETLEQLFAAAELDRSQFTPTEPRELPQSFADRRYALISADGATRVTAATLEGHPIDFHVDSLAASLRDENDVTSDGNFTAATGSAKTPTTWKQIGRFLLIGAAVALAFQARGRRRGDMNGALRVGVGTIALVVAFTICSGDHGGSWRGIVHLVMTGLTHGTAVGGMLGLYYFAVEPYARQVWPQSFIGWERALRGRWFDARVGRDLIAGLAIGLLVALALELQHWLPFYSGSSLRSTTDLFLHSSAIHALDGPLSAFGVLLEISVDLAREAFKFFAAIVLLRLLLRNTTLSLVIGCAIWGLVWRQGVSGGGPGAMFISWAIALSTAVAFMFALARYGLLSLVVAFVSFGVALSFPLQLDLAHWTSGISMMALTTLAGLTAFGAAAAMQCHRSSPLQ